MSKMPAKKKSCFQITSVTPAQVASSSVPDDNESLDDPDESRTEDVSSEIFDVSRADFEPETCDRSSSEETLNSVAETEAPGAMAMQVPQDVPAVSGPANGGVGFRRTAAGVAYFSPDALGASGPPTAPVGVVQQPGSIVSTGVTNVSAVTSQAAHVPPITSSVANTGSCSSRFRVIKLDHGSGEPFKRGRWTCTEFYERDTEIITRTVDNIRHASTLDHGTDRDSGLGTTGGSVTATAGHSAQGPESSADGLLTVHLQCVELQQQSSTVHQNAAGAIAHSTFQHPGYTVVPGSKPAAVSAAQQTQVGVTTAPPQNLLPPGHSGMQQSVQQVQKSPSMPPATQAQPFAYPAQLQQGHHLQTLVPAGQADYQQQHMSIMQPTGAVPQVLPVASLPAGPPVSQGPSPVMTPAAGGAPVLGLLVQSGESALGTGGVTLPGCQSVPIQGLLPQPGMGAGGSAVVPASQPQQAVSQHQPLGVAGSAPVSAGPHAVVSGLQNVPTVIPSVSSTPITTPNQTPPSVGQALHSQMHVAPSGIQSVPTIFTQVDENWRKSDALPQPALICGKDAMKPLIPESLQLATPAVNSLFGMSITIDGDEDSASGASIVAIDNKIEQAMDLVKSHLMYAVREEVEVLKEQIKELYERNSVLERENAVLKSLANNDQLSQLSVQLTNPCNSISPQQAPVSVAPQEGVPSMALPQQPNVSTA